MLVFPVKNLPILSKGKGNKIINIPSARAKTREELVTLLAIVPDGASVTLHAGRRKLTLKTSDIEHYRGERGRRGNKLPRGLQRVDQVEVEVSKAAAVEQEISDK
jgi:topoisomerase-4 subunit A